MKQSSASFVQYIRTLIQTYVCREHTREGDWWHFQQNCVFSFLCLLLVLGFKAAASNFSCRFLFDCWAFFLLFFLAVSRYVSVGNVNRSTRRTVPPPLTTDLSKQFDLQLKSARWLKQPRTRSDWQNLSFQEGGISGTDIPLCELIENHAEGLTESLTDWLITQLAVLRSSPRVN